MKIRRELMHVTTERRHIDGELYEPEEQTVTRVLDVNAPTGLSSGQAAPSNLATQVVVEAPAHEVAEAMSHPCRNCRFFDRARFQLWLSKADHPMAPMPLRTAVNEIRAALLMSNNSTLIDSEIKDANQDTDVEATMKLLAVCGALTEHYRNTTTVHPLSTCPREVKTKDRPHGFFVSRHGGATLEGKAIYDDIMKTAAGKKA